MVYELLKSIALALVRWGVPVPELALNRVQEYQKIRQLLREQRINCVIDVGANLGQSARIFRSLGYRGPIHSFEPHGDSFAVLERRAASDRNWWAYQLALGEASGQRILHANLEYPEMNSLLEPKGAPYELEPEEVPVRRLDNLFPEIVHGIAAPRVFLKIDTEGYDLKVFQGARSCLGHVYGLQAELFVAHVFEGTVHYLDALREFESAGFKLEHVSEVSYTDQGQLMCLNCLMSPAND